MGKGKRKKRSWEPLRFQLQKRSKLPNVKKKNAPVALQRTMDGIQKNFMGNVWIDPKEHVSERHVAEIIFDAGGYGEFNLLHWDNKRRNKRYDRTFICIGHSCPYYQDKTCRFYSSHKKGQACKANKYHAPNNSVYARVSIVPSENKEGWDYVWHHKHDKMKSRFKWFFKG